MIEGTRSGDTRVRDSSSGRGMPSAERKREEGRGKTASTLARELTRGPGAPPRRRRPQFAGEGRRRRDGAPGRRGSSGGKHREEERKREEKRQDADGVHEGEDRGAKEESGSRVMGREVFPFPCVFAQARRSPWSSVASASAFTCEIGPTPRQRNSRAPGQLPSRGRGLLSFFFSSFSPPTCRSPGT